MSQNQPAARVFTPDVVVILAGVVAALHIGKLPPAITALRADLGMSLVEAGFLLSLIQLAGMALGLVLGSASQGLGLKRSVLAGLAILCAASLLGGFVNSASWLLLLRGVEGVGYLLVVLPAPVLVRYWVDPDKLSRRLGFWSSFMGIGTTLALLVGPGVIVWFGWSAWWWLVGGVTAGVIYWVWRTVPDDQRPGAATPESERSAAPSLPARLRITLSHPGPWLIALLFGLYTGQWIGVIGFLPTVYETVGVAAGWAGVMTAVVTLANVVGNSSSGWLLHRGWTARNILLLGHTGLLVGAYLAFSAVTADWPVLRYLAVIMFSGLGGLIPGCLFSLVVIASPNPMTMSTTTGWMQQWGALGQFCTPPALAAVASQAGGWSLTWTVTGAMTITGILFVLAINRALGLSPRPATG